MSREDHHDPRAVNRMLVVANRTCPCPALLDEVSLRAADVDAEVLIVAPALNESKLRHWISDVDDSIDGAHRRLTEATEELAERGIAARGAVGDSEPLHAIGDALETFPAEAIIIGTHPPDASHWLEDGLVERARELFTVPVLQLESRYGLVV